MGLYNKLHEIQKTIRGLGKDTNGDRYTYVSGSKVLGIIRPAMDAHGVLLVPEVDSIHNEVMDYATRSGAKREMFTSLTLTFTWIDIETGEKLPCRFAANGMNTFDKGLGSALTYAERYFLLKFFHISTDEDDVDARRDDDAAPVTPEAWQPEKPARKPFPGKGSKPWGQAVAKMVNHENGVIDRLREYYEVTDEQAEMLRREAEEYIINNNLK